MMRKFPWATPAVIASLTDRQIWEMAFMTSDPETGDLIDEREKAIEREEQEAAAKQRASKPRSRWQRYNDFMTAGLLFATDPKEMRRQWVAKYGAVPQKDEE